MSNQEQRSLGGHRSRLINQDKLDFPWSGEDQPHPMSVAASGLQPVLSLTGTKCDPLVHLPGTCGCSARMAVQTGSPREDRHIFIFLSILCNFKYWRIMHRVQMSKGRKGHEETPALGSQSAAMLSEMAYRVQLACTSTICSFCRWGLVPHVLGDNITCPFG